MARGIFSCVFFVLVLTSCTSKVQMVDDKGQTADCHITYFGVLGTLIAASMQQTCIDEHQKKGFHEVPDNASPPPAAATDQAKKP